MAVREEFRIDSSSVRQDMERVEKEVIASSKRQTTTVTAESRKAGKQSAAEMVKGWNQERQARKGQLKIDLAEGLINKDTFRKLGREIDAEINVRAVAAMKKLGAEGRLTAEAHDRLSRSIRTSGVEAERAGRKGATAWERFRGTLFSVQGLVYGVAAAMTVRIGKALLDIGSDAIETRSKFETVFGGSAAALNKFVDNFAQKAGVVRREAQGMLGTTGSILQGLGFQQKESAATSEAVFRLSADLASFNNLQGGTAEVIGAVNSALTGERERLKALGIVLREADVQQRALANTGKDSVKALTDQDKATASLQLITERAGVAVGDLDRTMGSLANRRRAIGAAFKNMGEDIAVSLVPAFERLAAVIESSLPMLERFGRGVVGFVGTSLGMLDPAAAQAGVEIAGIRAQGMGEDGLRARLDIERAAFRRLAEEIRTAERELEDSRLFGIFSTGATGEARHSIDELNDKLEASRRVLAFLRAELNALPAASGTGDDAGGVGRSLLGLVVPRREMASSFPVDVTVFKDLEAQATAAAFALKAIREELDSVTAAQRALTQAQLEGDEEGQAQATAALAAAKAQLRVQVAAVAQTIRSVVKDDATLLEVQEALTKALKGAGVELKAQGKEWETWAEAAGTVEGLARGVLSVADAMGALDDQTRRVLQGIIDVAAAAQRIDLGDILSVGSLGGIAQLAGGVVALVGGLFGGRDAAAEELERQLAENARRIRENTQALHEFREQALSNVSGADREEIIRQGNALGSAFLEGTPGETRTSFTNKELNKWSEMVGIDIPAWLQNLEDITGAEFFDPEKGLTDLAEFRRAWAEFMDKGLGSFAENVGGAVDGLLFKWAIMGDAAGTAAEKVDQFIQALLGVPGGAAFAAALEAALVKGGPEAANALIDEWAKRLADGDQSLFAEGGAFFGLSSDEATRLLEEGNRLIEDWLGQDGGGFSRSVQIQRTITEVQAVEFIAWLQDIAFNTRDQLSELQEIHTLLATGLAASMPVGASAQSLSSVGGFTFNGDVHVGGGMDESWFREMWRRMGEEVLLKSQGRVG